MSTVHALTLRVRCALSGSGAQSQSACKLHFVAHSEGSGFLEVLVCMLKGRTDTRHILHVLKQWPSFYLSYHKEGRW